jgi:hypothetical protein
VDRGRFFALSNVLLATADEVIEWAGRRIAKLLTRDDARRIATTHRQAAGNVPM